MSSLVEFENQSGVLDTIFYLDSYMTFVIFPQKALFSTFDTPFLFRFPLSIFFTKINFANSEQENQGQNLRNRIVTHTLSNQSVTSKT